MKFFNKYIYNNYKCLKHPLTFFKWKSRPYSFGGSFICDAIDMRHKITFHLGLNVMIQGMGDMGNFL